MFNSRIWRTYRRESQVIYPPVAVETFYNRTPEAFYLAVSELVSYKRIEDAVRCFSHNGRQLKIVGEGPEYRSLKRLASGNIRILRTCFGEQLRRLYAQCRALVMPGEEDFGLVGVEAVASGKAVIGLGRGGVLESAPVENPRAGFFYDTPGETSLEEAIRTFEKAEAFISPSELQLWASRFSETHFAEAISRTIAAHTAGQFHNNFTSPLRQAV